MFHVKHRTDSAFPALLAPTPEAAEVFASCLPLAGRYWQWLAGPGVTRGLIGPREVDRLWDRHLVNCSVLSDFLPSRGPVVDLGSGAGLPGLVLALLRRDLSFVLVEPMQRRIDFLQEVIADLGLSGVETFRGRAQEYAKGHPGQAAAVVARAVTALDRLVDWSAPLLAEDGVLLALKGSSAATEVETARSALGQAGLSVEKPHPVTSGDSVTYVVQAQFTHPQTGPSRR